MASPHIAGIAALSLADNPSASAKEIQDKIVGNATPGKILMECSNTACSKSPNLMAFNGCSRH